MSPHRQHTFAIPQRPEPPPGRAVREGPPPLLLALLCLTAALGVAVLITYAITGAPPPDVKPIAAPQIITSPLPSLDAPPRLLQARLEDFRAGYEAAVQNGCQLRPLLAPPLEAHR